MFNSLRIILKYKKYRKIQCTYIIHPIIPYLHKNTEYVGTMYTTEHTYSSVYNIYPSIQYILVHKNTEYVGTLYCSPQYTYSTPSNAHSLSEFQDSVQSPLSYTRTSDSHLAPYDNTVLNYTNLHNLLFRYVCTLNFMYMDKRKLMLTNLKTFCSHCQKKLSSCLKSNVNIRRLFVLVNFANCFLNHLLN